MTFWIGIIGASLVPIVFGAQILKLLVTRETKGISRITFWAIVAMLSMTTIRAIAIGSPVFMFSQGTGLLASCYTLLLLYSPTVLRRASYFIWRKFPGPSAWIKERSL